METSPKKEYSKIDSLSKSGRFEALNGSGGSAGLVGSDGSGVLVREALPPLHPLIKAVISFRHIL